MGTFFFFVKCRVKEEERVRGSPPTALDKWLKKVTTDDTGLTRPPDVVCVSGHKDEVRFKFVCTLPSIDTLNYTQVPRFLQFYPKETYDFFGGIDVYQ